MFNQNFIILGLGILCILGFLHGAVNSENSCQNVQEVSHPYEIIIDKLVQIGKNFNFRVDYVEYVVDLCHS